MGNRVFALGLFALVASCSNGRASSTQSTSFALGSEPTMELYQWGNGPTAIGLRSAVAERAALGATAIAVGQQGEVFVLDAVNGRVARANGRALRTVAKVTKDAADLAVSSDGALAVRRTMTPRISVLDPRGSLIGEVDATPAGAVDSIELGPSRRVVVHSALQETFQLGSPSAAQLPEFALATKREGAAILPNGDGLTVVADHGEITLRVVTQATETKRSTTRSSVSIGRGTAARLAGVSGSIACVRVEHVDPASTTIAVQRDAICADIDSGAVVFRHALGEPGIYTPEHELAYAGNTLAFAHAEPEGLRLMTWTIEGGAR
jgi:hypothetical protein